MFKKKFAALWLGVVCCLLLAGCEAEIQKGGFGESETGNFYHEFATLDDGQGTYRIEAAGQVEDALLVVYFRAAEDSTVDVEMKLSEAKGGVRLDYVQPDGTRLPLGGNAVTDLTEEITFDWSLAVPAGESYLEWTSDEGGEMEFEISLSSEDDVSFSNGLPEITEEFYDLAELAELSKAQFAESSTMAVRNVDRKMAAGERLAFLYPAPEEPCTLAIFVWLAEAQGDLQLVYVQPEGGETVLWDSAGPENEPDEWIIDLVIDLLPGEGRLEWRTENGAEYNMSLMVESNEAAGVTGFSV